jgi:hypothetical protein
MTKSKRAFRKQRERERYQMRLEFDWLYDAVLTLLARHDPIGIAWEPEEGCDEYEPEVLTQVPRLREAASVDELTAIVREESDRWFGAVPAGHAASYRRLAEDIRALYIRWSRGEEAPDEEDP